ncbi:MAG: glycosyltransferase [Acidobacteria bacterium]|nr:glycosyltransferase [Acidobacteriota bacterium]
MPSIRRNFQWTLVGNSIFALSQWLVLVIITKLGNPELVGIYALGLAVTTPIFSFANLNLRAVQSTDASHRFAFSDYVTVRLVTSLLALMGIAIVVLITPYSAEVQLVILGIAGAKFFESFSDIVYGKWQLDEAMHHISISMMLRGVSTVLIAWIVFFLSHSLVVTVAAMACVWCLILIGFDVPMINLRSSQLKTRNPKPGQGDTQTRRHGDFISPSALSPSETRNPLTSLIWLALPLGAVMLLNTLNVNLPRYWVERHLGLQHLGILAALFSLVLVGTTLINALGQAASPRLAKFYAAGRKRDFVRLLTLLAGCALVIGIGGVLGAFLFGPPVVSLLFTPQYAAQAHLLIWVMVYGLVTYFSSVAGYGVTAARFFRIQVPCNGIETLCLVGGCTVLIPQFGLIGAIWSSILAAMVHAGLKCATLWVAVRRCEEHSQSPDPVISEKVTPIRILHVFGQMNRGGAEMRTVELLKSLNPSEFEFHFATLSGLPGDLDEEISSLGGVVHPIRLSAQFPLQFYRLMKAVQCQVVHSHVHYFSGAVLFIARLARVPIRIAHFRSVSDGRIPTLSRRIQTAVMSWLIDCFATNILAVCQGAMDASWKQWQSDNRCEVVYNGLDTSRFQGPSDRQGVCREFGLDPESPFFIHVGRMDPAKNHVRLMTIFHQVLHRLPAARLVLVGRTTPDIQLQVNQLAETLGIADRLVFAGVRTDVPRLLKAADLMIFPSRWEGLPGAVLEACVAGTPVVASNLPGVKEIASEIGLVWEVSLDESDAQWADRVMDLFYQSQSTRSRVASMTKFEQSHFSISACLQELYTIWRGGITHA